MERGAGVRAPFVLLAQQSLFDPARAPAGKQAAWAYCHVPNGSARRHDRPDRARRSSGSRPASATASSRGRRWGRPTLEAHNPNYVGGDINGGAADLRQLFTRPVARRSPYTTPIRGVFLCSSSTPPGGGVHGMCGYYAAQAALRHLEVRR